MSSYNERRRLTYATPRALGLRAEGQYSYADMRVDTVLKRLRRAVDALEGWSGDARSEEWPPMEAAEDLALAYGLLDKVRWAFPRVTGYAVGYFWGTSYRGDGMSAEEAEAAGCAWSTFSAHLSEDEAEDFRVAWESKQRARDGGRHYLRWRVRLVAVSITDFVKSGTDALTYVRNSGAFS